MLGCKDGLTTFQHPDEGLASCEQCGELWALGHRQDGLGEDHKDLEAAPHWVMEKGPFLKAAAGLQFSKGNP